MQLLIILIEHVLLDLVVLAYERLDVSTDLFLELVYLKNEALIALPVFLQQCVTTFLHSFANKLHLESLLSDKDEYAAEIGSAKQAICFLDL